jgi:flagellar motor switch protein FliM
MQTMGRISPQPPVPRKPTRTDAAMVAGFVDSALQDLELSLASDADLIWAGGFRYASYLDDPRPLGLLLEDVPYRVLAAEVSLSRGAKAGQVLLALPAEGRGKRPSAPRPPASGPVPTEAFAQALTDLMQGNGSVVPIGLVHTAVGGTMIEQWSPFDAQAACVNATCLCTTPGCDQLQPINAANCTGNGQLFNALVAPFVNMSVFGWLWYQGKAARF